MRKSVFGSLRSLGPAEDEPPTSPRVATSIAGDEEDEVGTGLGIYSEPPGLGLLSAPVLHHGEVMSTSGVWRKKSQYLVLTERHLVRFKNQSKASEVFPSIPASWGRVSGSSATSNRLSMGSVTSFQDFPPALYADAGAIPLNSIVAVHRVDDGRPSYAIEVCFLDERTLKPSAIQMQPTDPDETELWLNGIRGAAKHSCTVEPMLFDEKVIRYAIRMVEAERDYDPDFFQLFRVVQRLSTKSNIRTSTDDLSKLTSTVCYLAIGFHKLHLIPLPKTTTRTSSISVSESDSWLSCGIMMMTAITVQPVDDSFQLLFRAPTGVPFALLLSSSFSHDICLFLRQRAEFLRPRWLRQPFSFTVPKHVEMDVIPPPEIEEDHGCFDRTLTAYCAAFDADTSNIRYTIDYLCRDAPCFRLLPPAVGRDYSAVELLAVMRALRYNETFCALSFANINLEPLQLAREPFGVDMDAVSTYENIAIYIPGQETMTVLSQELRSLALKSRTLRRMDFSFTNARTPLSGKGVHDPGCGIPEALFPLCRRRLTTVDWIILNGIKLGDSDLDYLVDAASQKSSRLRALCIGNCGLSVHDLDLIMSTVRTQEDTLEAIDISGVQGRMSPELFQQQIGYFAHIRQLNLSHVSCSTGPEPLISSETLLAWELEELSLSHTAINKPTVDSIATYLFTDKSLNLRELCLDQCGLTGKDVAVFLHSMIYPTGEPRVMHLRVSENRLHEDYAMLFDAIERNLTPTHLTMRMIEFQKEEHFRYLAEALRKNTSLKYLDIAQASLPYDASPETCRSLQLMFEENKTLEELDISGECAHLDVARFGIGLNLSLTGLKNNHSLRVLKIEHQRLGLQGANTLASVLEENSSLLEVYCENNEINLQSFTVLVNALTQNKTVLFLPSMARDRIQSLERVRREFENVTQDYGYSHRPISRPASTFKRTIQAAVGTNGTISGNKLGKPAPFPTSPLVTSTPHSYSSLNSQEDSQLQVVMRHLDKKWEVEVERLQKLLMRNCNIARGITDETEGEGGVRPSTALSASAFLDRASSLGVPKEDGSPVTGYGYADNEIVLNGSPSEFGSTPASDQEPESPVLVMKGPSRSRDPFPSGDEFSNRIGSKGTSYPPLSRLSSRGSFFPRRSSSSVRTNSSVLTGTDVNVRPSTSSRIGNTASSLRSFVSSGRSIERSSTLKKKESRAMSAASNSRSSVYIVGSRDGPPRLELLPF